MHLYGSFEEKGYKFEAYIPATDAEPVAFEVRILIGNTLKHSLLVPMSYVPVFGVDSGDVAHLESVADRIINLLPVAQDFGDDAISSLDKLETEIGGKRERERQAKSLETPDREIGQFEYVTDLFIAKFADMLGGRGAADQWMKTKAPQLGDRTPEEALRLGMVQEVMKCIEDVAR